VPERSRYPRLYDVIAFGLRLGGHPVAAWGVAGREEAHNEGVCVVQGEGPSSSSDVMTADIGSGVVMLVVASYSVRGSANSCLVQGSAGERNQGSSASAGCFASGPWLVLAADWGPRHS
jgi:hypothetical protein